MSYVTAVTDRVLSDITTPTSKGYWNVADFVRVYGNAQVVNSLASINFATPIVFNTITTPTTSTITGTYADMNALISNIERIRAAVTTWIPGTSTAIEENVTSFDYRDVNLWESTLDTIWIYMGGPSKLVCPTLTGDLTRTTGSTITYIDCLDMADYNIDLQGTAKLNII